MAVTMRTFFTLAMLAAALAITPARAQTDASDEPPQAVKLDMDKDGKLDWATLTGSGGGTVDLRIFMAVLDETPDLSRAPDIIKKDIAGASFNWLVSKGDGSLIVKSGCGGCSNDTVTALTIVHRGGEFLMAGYALFWDTRTAIGSCEVNFLTGEGFVTKGLDSEVTKRFKPKFGQVKLADWSQELIPKECEI